MLRLDLNDKAAVTALANEIEKSRQDTVRTLDNMAHLAKHKG